MVRHRSRAPLPAALLCALLALAGCLGAAGPAGPGGTVTTTGAAGDSAFAPGETTDCGDAWVSYWGLGGDGTRRVWAPDRVLVGYSVPGGVTRFLVAFENDTALGAATVRYDTGGDYGVTADGDEVPLDRPLSGVHTVRVVMFADADGDGSFARGTDPACTSEGSLVATGAERLNFSAFAGDGGATTGA